MKIVIGLTYDFVLFGDLGFYSTNVLWGQVSDRCVSLTGAHFIIVQAD